MDLQYSEHPDYQFPYWMALSFPLTKDEFETVMSINEWTSQTFGELGIRWGYERTTEISYHKPDLNPVRVRLHHTTIVYYWRFLHKEDAMVFKLRWGGA
jgi:hypothetical protein